MFYVVREFLLERKPSILPLTGETAMSILYPPRHFFRISMINELATRLLAEFGPVAEIERGKVSSNITMNLQLLI